MKSFDPIWLFPLTLLGVLLGAGFAILTRGRESSLEESASDLAEPGTIHPGTIDPELPQPTLAAPETSPVQIAPLASHGSSTLDSIFMDNTATPGFPDRIENNLETSAVEPQPTQSFAGADPDESDAESDIDTFAALNSLSPAHNPGGQERSTRDQLTRDNSDAAAIDPFSQTAASDDLTQSADELNDEMTVAVSENAGAGSGVEDLNVSDLEGIENIENTETVEDAADPPVSSGESEAEAGAVKREIQLQSSDPPVSSGESEAEAGAVKREIQLQSSIPAIPSSANFNLESLQRTIVETLQGQVETLQTATADDVYALLAGAVRQQLLQINPERQLIRSQPRITVEIAARFGSAPSLETQLLNLGVLEQVTEALQQLGIDLPESSESAWEDDLGSITGNLLESLTTADQPAIGYGLDLTSHRALQGAIAAPVPTDSPTDSSAPAGDPASTGNSTLPTSVAVKFGGYVETYNLQGRLCKRWLPAQIFPAVAYDIPISGYGRTRVNLLRLWRAEQPLSSSLALPDEFSLKQSFLLVSAAIQDVIRLHLASGAAIETLSQRFALHLHDTALAIAELMHQLVDQHQLEWDQAWSITQDAVSSTFHSLPALPSDQCPIDLFSRLLPRHLEIINEINRRFLDAVRQRYPGDEERVGRMSLVDRSYLRGSHLTWVGSSRVAGITPLHTQLIQQFVLPDFSQFDATKFSHGRLEITPRRFLLQTNPRLANLLNAVIGDGWITHPERLQQLETLVNDAQFCGNWWQIKRDNKRVLAAYIEQNTGLTVNLNSLFDVQAMPIEPGSRQLLNLLHVITLYARLKTNSSTDTIQRFAHRSVPRTCIFAGAASDHPLAQAIAASIRAVSAAINGDPDVQGRLQVVLLEDIKTLRLVYAAADLIEQIPLADHEPPSVIPFKFALNGAITIGTPNSTNLEIRQAVDPKNLFLFGMTLSEANSLKARGYNPHQFYSADPELQQVINPIASGYFTYGDDSLKPLAEWLVYQDPTLILAEYASYMNCQERVSQVFQDQKTWTWMSMLTTAHMGPFCSGNSIQRAVPTTSR
jgi:starch phosphorylase